MRNALITLLAGLAFMVIANTASAQAPHSNGNGPGNNNGNGNGNGPQITVIIHGTVLVDNSGEAWVQEYNSGSMRRIINGRPLLQNGFITPGQDVTARPVGGSGGSGEVTVIII